MSAYQSSESRKRVYRDLLLLVEICRIFVRKFLRKLAYLAQLILVEICRNSLRRFFRKLAHLAPLPLVNICRISLRRFLRTASRGSRVPYPVFGTLWMSMCSNIPIQQPPSSCVTDEELFLMAGVCYACGVSCHKRGVGLKKICIRCRKVGYCSRECQQYDLKRHKRVCNKMKKSSRK